MTLSCIPWAIGVGWSRVAKGKHFPLDAVVGAVVGLMLGYLVEDVSSDYERAAIKTITGVFATGNWAYYVFIPLFDSHSKVVLCAALVFLCTFAWCMVQSTTDIPFSVAGVQSIKSIDALNDDGVDLNTAYECTRLW